MFDGASLNETQRTLLKAKERISDPEQWCGNGASDYTAQGRKRVCALIATNEVIGPSAPNERYRYIKHLHEAAREFGALFIGDLNDHADHATVMTCFDRAIELAGEGQ